MAYSGRYESEGESSTEDLSEEDLDTSYWLLHTKCEEACLTINNHKKTIGFLQKEINQLALTITCVQKKVSSLNSKLEHVIQFESNVTRLYGMVEFGGISRDMNRINFGISMKVQYMKIPSTKVVLPEMKTGILRSLHMSHLCLKCHQCAKFGHIRPYCYDSHEYHHLHSPSKLMNRRCTKVYNKKWKSNATPTSPITHTTCRCSSSKGRYFNIGRTRDMYKETIVHVTHGNR